MNKTELHPCFDLKAKMKYARVHLPVAPKCNVQCKYCNRKYDCVNESRPGITSAVLSPYQALNYLKKISEKVPNISTIGIAGPGDAFAEPEKTLETIRLIKSAYPDKIFCLSTNGLEIAKYVKELVALDVTHVTLTINSIRPATLQKVYNWVRFNKKVYRGPEAARVIKEQQMKALEALKESGITVKVNTIIMPGINDSEIEEVARVVAAKGAATMNCIPLIPAEGSDMENHPSPTAQSIISIHKGIAKYIKPMTHCARCRADAAGKIGHDEPDAMRVLHECSLMPTPSSANKPYVAVASYEGLLINQHLGETDCFLIFKQEGDSYKQIERRKSAAKGRGDLRWIELSRILRDCRYVLVNGVGAKPVEILQRVGIGVVEMSGLITDGLDAVYKGKKLKAVIKTSTPKCGETCSGNGMGCG
jgi:nitrogen fixation protein NifB